MSDTQTSAETAPWSRAQPTRSGPRRAAGGMYRTAEGARPGTGGVPLNSADARVVAAVRLAYQVAEAQVDRSLRLARRLREAGDREVGAGSDAQGLEATEQLVMKTLLSGLEWWEGSVVEGRCPVKRLAAAEYQMIGQILGFTTPAGKQPSAGGSAAPKEAPARTQGVEPAAAAPARRLLVVHAGEPKNRRRVAITSWELTAAVDLDPAVFFRHAELLEAEAIEAKVAMAEGGDLRLAIATPPHAAPGVWTCALCDAQGVQVGHIALTL